MLNPIEKFKVAMLHLNRALVEEPGSVLGFEFWKLRPPTPPFEAILLYEKLFKMGLWSSYDLNIKIHGSWVVIGWNKSALSLWIETKSGN